MVRSTYSSSCRVLKDLGQSGHLLGWAEDWRSKLVRDDGATYEKLGLDGDGRFLDGELISADAVGGG
jgi:hypothetical protein